MTEEELDHKATPLPYKEILRDIERPKYISCACSTEEHTLRFAYIRDEKDPGHSEVYTSMYMSLLETRWWKRVWYSIKYIFGYRCRYGHFCCWVLNPRDLDDLIGLLRAYKMDMLERVEELKENNEGTRGNSP